LKMRFQGVPTISIKEVILNFKRELQRLSFSFLCVLGYWWSRIDS
jgi:hypothetical protein